MRLTSLVACFGFVQLLGTGAMAQDAPLPPSAALMNRIDAALAASADPVNRLSATSGLFDQLSTEGAADPVVPVYVRVLRSELAADVALFESEAAMSTLVSGDEDFEAAAGGFLSAMANLSEGVPPSRTELYAIGEAADRLIAGGMALFEVPMLDKPEILEFLDNAIKVYKAGLSAEDIARGSAPDRAQAIRDFFDLLPAKYHPALGGPAGTSFAALMGWNGEMYDTVTEATNLIGEAIERGELDMERFNAITDRLEQLKSGPWGAKAGEEFLKKLAESMPWLGNAAKALWPDLDFEDEEESPVEEGSEEAQFDAGQMVAIDWYRDNVDLREQDIFLCPANPERRFSAVGTVGTGRYLRFSAVCVAAAHMGIITVEGGGAIQIDAFTGHDGDTYLGSEQNRITTESWARNWGGFVPIPAGGEQVLD